MRILFVINLPYSSIEILAQEALSVLEPQGIEIFWVYMNQLIELIDTCPEMLKFVDLIHFMIDVQSFSYEHIKKAADLRPILTSYHHWNFKEIPKQLELVDHIFYVAKGLESEVQQLKPEKATTSIVCNGVDTKVFCPTLNQKNRDNFVIGFFGTQRPNSRSDRKGSRLLLEATKIMVESGYKPTFLIMGYGWKNFVPALRKLGCKVSYKVSVPREDVPKYYHQLDLYAITSRIEGGPLTLLEAGACGIPIISTPVGIAVELLAKPGCGKLLSGFDSQEIAEAIIFNMENPQIAQSRAEVLLQEIRQYWTWEESYKDLPQTYFDIYNRIAKSAPLKLSSIHRGDIPPYLNLQQDAVLQRRIARNYALFYFAFCLYDHGEKIAALRTGLPLLPKIKPSYFWQELQREEHW
ncbi:glycosyltransferase family 4 protein [Coleofasciculus sp. G2-EDA-02]|uniref:glycosyltransferase family 4 protein n=1 Tax=Coleofasciculus sp. G2-EDA-02 TaxID=3069529 RepID=UPI0032F9217C